MIRTKDQFTLWVLAGVIGVIVRDIYSLLAKFVGLANFFIWQLGASLFVEKAEVTTFWGNTIGILADLVIGGMFGVFMGLLLKWQGKKNYVLKGMGIGVIAWMFFYGILYHNLPFTKTHAPGSALSNFSAFIGHSIFGITMATVYVKWLSKFAAESQDTVNEPNGKSTHKKYYISPSPARKTKEADEKVRLRKPIKLQ